MQIIALSSTLIWIEIYYAVHSMQLMKCRSVESIAITIFADRASETRS